MTLNGQAQDIERILISAEQLQTRVAELGAQISADYAGLHPVLVGVLRGVFVFMADLVRSITIPVEIDFIGITRYSSNARTSGGRSPVGVVRFTKDLEIDVTGRHVLFVEDVIDTGLSIRYILGNLRAREPASLRVCTLFDKPHSRLFTPQIDYTGFVLENQFVVGYGLDYDERYRNLPFIGVLKEETIKRQRLPPGAQTI